MAVRQIEEADFAQIKDLLCEGFPRQSPAYWNKALQILKDRAAIADLPRYGFAIDTAGRLDGVLLTIASQRQGQIFCNLSSWYVREGQRQNAIFLLRRAMRPQGVTYTDISPVNSIIEMIGKLGFTPHTGGVVLLTSAQILSSGKETVQDLDSDFLNGLPISERERILFHLAAGCTGLLVGQEPVLYRMKRLKRILPCARFVSGRPERLIASAGPLMRTLALRGIPFAMLDVPRGWNVPHGRHFPHRELRYATGDLPPAAGDLLDTELALFGP